MMEELKSEKQFFYSLDELGSVVTSAMESSVAALSSGHCHLLI